MAGSMDFLLNLKANPTGFNQGVNSAKFAVNALVGAMASLGVGLSVNSLIQTADQFTTLQTRVKIAVGETGNFREAMSGVYQVAISTNTSLDATASLFARLNDVGKQMGLTQQQVLEVTKTINQAIQLSGGGAQASEAAVTQLTQALQSGVLRGDEFNSIMEQSPAIIKALAADLEVTTGELRKMAENGELSAERVVTAIRNQSAAIQDEYSKFPITVSQALGRIGTAWTKVIGEFNEGTGTTSSIANALLYIADNLDIVKTFLEDVEAGFATLKDGLGAVDAGTIYALKEAVLAAYDTIKELGSSIADVAKIGVDALNTISTSFGGFVSDSDKVSEKVTFLTRVFQGISIVAGAVADGIYGIRVAANLLVGALYDGASAASYWLSKLTFGDVSKDFAAQAEILGAKARDYYTKADKMAMDFQSKTIQNLNEAAKTVEQKNAEKLASNKSTLEKLAADETKALAEQAANNEKRKQLEVDLGRAKVANNESAITEIRKQLTQLDESDDAFSKSNISRQDEKLKAAVAFAEASIEGNNKVLSGQAQAELAAKGFITTIDSAGKVTVKAFDDGKKAADGFGLSATKVAENAAKALGVDLDVAFNRLSKGFGDAEKQIKQVADAYVDLKARGDDAAKLLGMSLDELLQKAKNQAEIERVRQLYVQYGKDGKLSTQQVGDGLDAVNDKLNKQTDSLNAVQAAFKKFGLMGQEEANKLSSEYEQAFYTLVNSGQATSEQLQEAWGKWQRSIGSAKSDAIQSSLDVAASMSGIEQANDNVTRSSERISRSYDRVGDSAISATQRAQQGVQSMVNSLDIWSQKLDEITRKQGGMTGSDFLNGGSSANSSVTGAQMLSYSQEQIAAQLQAMGFDQEKANLKAKDIFNDQSWARGGVSIGNGQLGLSKFGDLTNFDYVNAQLDKLSKISNASTGSGEPTKVIRVDMQLGGQTVPLTTDATNETQLLDWLKRAKSVS